MNSPTRENLINRIFEEMVRKGNHRCIIKNLQLRTNEEQVYAIADVSYTWRLHAWEKRVKHEGMIFVYVDGEWKSPLFV